MTISQFPRAKFSDVIETVVRPSSAFANAADPVTAELLATARTEAVSLVGVRQLDVFVDVDAALGASTKLYIKLRFSGKKAPDIATLTDWGFIQIDNINGTTGFSSVQEYVIEIDLVNANGSPHNAARRYISRLENVSGRFASALVWVDNAGASGTVTFLRQGGGM